jgi:hypothetical protein
MTEAEWLGEDNPEAMLAYLAEVHAAGGWASASVSDRKLRLFAVACCRRVWDLMPAEQCRHAVVVAEQHADGLADLVELRAAESAVRDLEDRGGWSPTLLAAIWLAYWTADRSAWSAAQWIPTDDDTQPLRDDHAQAGLLRDLFGNPFRPAPVVPASCLSWHDGLIPKLAQAIYEEWAFDRLGVLGDALEEAGCADEAILGHCHSGGEHARGCWLVDLVLGKR